MGWWHRAVALSAGRGPYRAQRGARSATTWAEKPPAFITAVRPTRPGTGRARASRRSQDGLTSGTAFAAALWHVSQRLVLMGCT
jgi:hypothetical protein